jgi:membrane-anchored glycerophosphoryl diester phosphodiesterase (GDPDase)
MLISITQLIKKSYELYIKNFVLFVKYSLLVFLPSGVIVLLGEIARQTFDLDNLTPEKITPFIMVLGFVFVILSIIGYFISLWFSLTFIRIISNKYENLENESIKNEIMKTKSLIFTAFITSLLSGLAVFAGLILFIIPGIIFSIWFAFAIYSVVLDNQKDTNALRFSKSIVVGRWWAVLLRLFVPTIIYLIVVGIVQAPLDFLAKTINSSLIIYITLTLSTIINFIATPFLVSSQTILYIELKKTKNLPEQTPEQTITP